MFSLYVFRPDGHRFHPEQMIMTFSFPSNDFCGAVSGFLLYSSRFVHQADPAAQLII
jgi:hypothetical protein